MASIRYPRPLRPGDRIGVTSPSAGVDDGMRPRLEFALDWLTDQGYEVVVGECMDGAAVVSAPARARAEELTRMLTDPTIAAVAPPWGGELAVEILPHLDVDAIAAAEPTWMVGYSDTSTVLTALTTLTGTAAVHGQNLMESPNELPDEIAHWTRAMATPAGGTLEQSASRTHRARAAGWLNLRGEPMRTEHALDEPGRWHPTTATADATATDDRIDVSGRLIGGCIETLAAIAGSRYGDVTGFAETYAPEGLIVHVEASDSQALDIARNLWSLRLAGWFEHANAVLVGRTWAPDADGFTQADAVASALGDLDVPVILDVDCGHVTPQLALIDGATARVVLDADVQTITQTLD